ncbi:MAG: IS630 family transposase [Candidatus Moeniiplasma glomeromycotorum]|nr:IS630 family transposase [Candidatus Moeniiplasma glomeromycotorum]
MIQEYEFRMQQITKLREKNFSWNEIADFYQVSERTAYRWRKPICWPQQKRGRKSRVNQIVLELLCFYVKDNNTATLKETSEYLYQRTDQRFSQATIFRVLKREGITWKKGDKQYSEQDKEKIRRFITENSWLLSSNSFSALDESSFNLGAVPRYARSHKSKRAVVKQPGKRGCNYTLLLCIRNTEKQAVISYKLIKNEKKKIKDKETGKVKFKKGTDAIDFYNFLKDIELPIDGNEISDSKHYLLLDNSRIHSAPDKLKEAGLLSIGELAEQKNIVLIHLPKYVPELNPTEKCFSIIKQYYRQRRSRTEEELRKVIEEAIEILQKKDLTKIFKNCFDYENWH